jgi:hypothetical protein
VSGLSIGELVIKANRPFVFDDTVSKCFSMNRCELSTSSDGQARVDHLENADTYSKIALAVRVS